MTDWKRLDQTYLMSTVRRYPITIAKAEGNYLYDTTGKRYLDLFTGLAVNVLGHAHPHLLKAFEQQGQAFLHISNLFLNPPAIRLAERLVQHTFGKGKVYFGNSGAEATEAALKLIHKWTIQAKNGKHGIVVLQQSFHGRTLGALHLTRQAHAAIHFPPLHLPVYEVEPNDVEVLRNVCHQHQPAAILVEPILGAGGIIPLTSSYMKMMATICRDQEILLCMDEIQTGAGRTGTLFAYQAFPIQPDLILFAKGMGGGLPLGGIIANEKLADIFQPGDHGTTFAPSPLSAAMGNAVLDILLEAGMLTQGQQTANQLWQQLASLQARHPQVIHSITGRGMMIGIHMQQTAEEMAKLQQSLLQRGILVNITAGTVMRLLPPLTLTVAEMQRFIDTLEQIIYEKEDSTEVHR
jgi:acetylornithine/N-succinyldiaminopimelate aminotransferase